MVMMNKCAQGIPGLFSCLKREEAAEGMPIKPKKPCAFQGCPELVDPGETYCEKHKALKNKEYDKYQRSPSHNKRYGNNWRKIRAAYVKAHPLCEECLKIGKMTPVEEVHHVIPLSAGGTNRWENLMSLCQSCHTKKHLELGDRKLWK